MGRFTHTHSNVRAQSHLTHIHTHTHTHTHKRMHTVTSHTHTHTNVYAHSHYREWGRTCKFFLSMGRREFHRGSEATSPRWMGNFTCALENWRVALSVVKPVWQVSRHKTDIQHTRRKNIWDLYNLHALCYYKILYIHNLDITAFEYIDIRALTVNIVVASIYKKLNVACVYY